MGKINPTVFLLNCFFIHLVEEQFNLKILRTDTLCLLISAPELSLPGFEDYMGAHMGSSPFPDMQSGVRPAAHHMTPYPTKISKTSLHTHLSKLTGTSKSLRNGHAFEHRGTHTHKHTTVPEVLAGQNMPPSTDQSVYQSQQQGHLLRTFRRCMYFIWIKIFSPLGYCIGLMTC